LPSNISAYGYILVFSGFLSVEFTAPCNRRLSKVCDTEVWRMPGNYYFVMTLKNTMPSSNVCKINHEANNSTV